jgi:hypothetical protein
MLSGNAPRETRKRKRHESDLQTPIPPPFAPARAALAASYAGPAPRSLRSGSGQPIVSLVAAAAMRLTARDFRGAASILPVLLRRFRQAGRSKWSFPREASLAGAEVLRRLASPSDLESFLSLIVRDVGSSSSRCAQPEAYPGHARESALLELTVELIAAGRMRDALEALRAEAPVLPFVMSPLVHAYIGMLSIALSIEDDDPAALLSSAICELITAAKLDPTAHCFIHYAAAAAVAAGDTERALEIQRDFVRCNPSDPLALKGLLSSLNLLRENECYVERVEIARKLLRADPVSTVGLQTIREACLWSWGMEAPVSLVEVADILASRIECGVGDESIWGELLDVLQKATDVDISRFMFASGRSSWWSLYFFRPGRAALDAAASATLATTKKSVSEILFADCEYARRVASIVSGSKLDDAMVSAYARRDCDE